MGCLSTIHAAEAILPGDAAPQGELDPRWQATIAVGEFVESHPHEVWQFAARWGTSDDSDLRMAIATCLVEHLLEQHFETVFPLVRELARSDRNFSETFLRCWKCGQGELPENSRQFDALRDECTEFSCDRGG